MASTASVKSTPKRLIICCDGTWQSSVTGQKNVPSNVTRLARAFAREGKDKTGQVWQQIVYYDAGIGTGDIRKFEKDRQGGFGHGFVGNVIEAYNFLATNYEQGDKVYCFGFSRGAYTARAVAGLVNDIGIISARDMQDFPELFKLYQGYRGDKPHGFRMTKEFRKWENGVRSTLTIPQKDSSKPHQATTSQTALMAGSRSDSSAGSASDSVSESGSDSPSHSTIPSSTSSVSDSKTEIKTVDDLKPWDQIPHSPVSEGSRIVEVVGVFDTVGSLGVPKSPYFTVRGFMGLVNKVFGGEEPGFHNIELSPYIRNAFHAMALDEHRKPFTPTLWQLGPETTKPHEKEATVPSTKDRDQAYKDFKALHRKTPIVHVVLNDKGQPIKNVKADEQQRKDDEKELQNAWEKVVDMDMRMQRAKLPEPPNLRQVWFPGVHINVGGGNSDVLEERRGDFEQIALISFAWMVEQCKPFLQFEERIRKRSVRDRMALIQPIRTEIRNGLWKEYGDWIKPLWRGLEYLWLYSPTKREFAKGVIVGWAEGPIVDSYTPKHYLGGSQYRTPGDYGTPLSKKGDKDKPSRETMDSEAQTPDAHDDPSAKKTDTETIRYETKEAIHPSVAYRMRAVKDYNPRALEGFTRAFNGTKWMWTKPAPPERAPWFWQKLWPSSDKEKPRAIEVEEEAVPLDEHATGTPKSECVRGKFSRFLTKNYVDFLVKLEQEEDEDVKKGKTSKATEAERALRDKAQLTDATFFLEATAEGKDWGQVVTPPKRWWSRFF